MEWTIKCRLLNTFINSQGLFASRVNDNITYMLWLGNNYIINLRYYYCFCLLFIHYIFFIL